MTQRGRQNPLEITIKTKTIAIIEKHAQEILEGFHSKGLRLEMTEATSCLLERYFTIEISSDGLGAGNLVVASSIQDFSRKSFFDIASKLGKDGQDCYLTGGSSIKRSFEKYFEKLYYKTGKKEPFNRNMPFSEIL